MKSAWLYFVLGGVLLYVLWGLHVDATVTAGDVVVTYKPSMGAPPIGASSSDAIDWAMVDQLPL